MSAVFTTGSFTSPAGCSWLASGSSDSAISPFDENFPKQEIFEDVDLSKLPASLLSDPDIEASSLEAVAYEGASFQPQQQVMNGVHYHPSCRNNSWPVYNETPSNYGERKLSHPQPSRMGEEQTTPDSKRRCPQTPSSARKRKSVGSGTESSSRSSVSPSPQVVTTPSQPRKTTHNMIEKRYRTNLNDKIAALRDAVPSLRIMVHRLGREGEGVDDTELAVEAESLGGLAPAHKLNKATVLSKATEYIAHLERSNEALHRENNHLRHRVVGLEMMMMGRNPGYGGVWG